MDAVILALTLLLPVHGALWYGVRSERQKNERMFRMLIEHTSRKLRNHR